MYKIILAVLILVFCTASIMPPELPSSFWGYATGIPAGANIEISQNGIILAQAQVMDYGGVIAYTVNVTGGSEGDVLQFKYNGAVVGYGTYHIGTNQQLDIVLITVGRIKPGRIR